MFKNWTVSRASIIVGVVGICVLFGLAASTVPVAAIDGGDAEVSSPNPANESVTSHDWEFTNETSVEGIDEIHLNYTDGVNFEYVHDVNIGTDGFTADSNTTEDNNISIELNDPPTTLDNEEQLNVSIVGIQYTVPVDVEPEIQLWNETDEEYRVNDTANLEIYESEFIDGEVVNDTAGEPIEDYNIDVIFQSTDDSDVTVNTFNESNDGDFGILLPSTADDDIENQEYNFFFQNDNFVNRTERGVSADELPIFEQIHLNPGGTIAGAIQVSVDNG